jgi:signal transduction histidine kinase
MALVTLVLSLPIAIMTLGGTLGWIGHPFPGFFVMANGVVPTVGLYSWTGLGGGVPFHARVVQIDGVSLAGHSDLYEAVADRPVGTPVTYTLVKDRQTFTRTVPTMEFGRRDYWLTVGLLGMFGVLSIAMGVGVGLLQPRLRAAHAFLLQGVLTGLYALTGTALYDPDLEGLSRLHHVFQALFPASFIHLGLTFPVTRDFVRRRPTWLTVPYILGLLLSLWVYASFYASVPDTAPLYATYLWAALAIVVLVGLVTYTYRENRSPMVRHQLRIVLPGLVVGTVLGFVAYLDNMRSGGAFPSNLIALSPLVFYVSIAYAIVRRDLFDVDTLLRQTAIYLTLTACITVFYVTTVTLLGLTVPDMAARMYPVELVFVVAVAFLILPVRNGVQHLLDRTFFRSRPDYRTTVRDVSTALPALLDLDAILARVATAIRHGFHLRSLAVVLWLDDCTRVWHFAGDAESRRELVGPPLDALRTVMERDPTRSWMLPDDELSPADLALPSLDERSARADMATLGAVVILPIVAGNTLLGAFAVGPRLAGIPFGARDFDLLATVAAQSSIAIHNALSYREVQEARARLEERVLERTAELETTLAELRSTQAQLLQTEKLASLGQLVAGIAHEINNPVTFIVGNVDPIADELKTIRDGAMRLGDGTIAEAAEAIERMVGLIREGAERTAGIVQDLRTFSRAGGATPHPTDLHEGLEITLRLLRPKWGTRISIHRDYGDVPPVHVVPGQLNQVLMNLLANACDAITERGNLWITTRRDDDSVRIAIRDDGVGMAAAEKGRMFDPFFTTKPQGQGTGLGLSITYGIVRDHDGRIDVESEPGAGTTITVVLPLVPRHAGPIETNGGT